MLSEALLFLLNTLLQPFAAVLLLRFHLQWLHAPMRNPLGEFIMAISNFAVLRVRRFIPPARGLDIASLMLAFGVEAMYLSTTYWIVGLPITEFSPAGADCVDCGQIAQAQHLLAGHCAARSGYPVVGQP